MQQSPSEIRNPTAEVVIPAVATRGALLRHTFAHWVSTIIHPLLFPLVTLIVVALSITHNLGETLLLALLSVALTSLPVAAVVWVQVKRGKWTDLDVSQRRQRYTLYPFTFGCLGLLIYLYYRLGAPSFAVRSALGLLLANIVDGGINLFWKVSAHATTAAVCAALLWQLLPGAWGPFAAAGAALVGWSRVELQRHTPGQVLAGWFVGASSAVVALHLFA